MSSTTTNHDAEEPPMLQREDGKMKATFNPRQLNVTWGRDPRYWKMSGKGSNRPAELLRVCWLEVSGSVPIGSVPPGTKYRITFQISLKSDAFGWNGCPVYVIAKFGKEGKYSWKKISLQAHYSQPTSIPLTEGLEIETEDANDTLYFGLYDIRYGWWYPENINMCLCVVVVLCAACSLLIQIGIKDAEFLLCLLGLV